MKKVNEKRNIQFNLRLSKKEYKKLEQTSKKNMRSKNNQLREFIMNSK